MDVQIEEGELSDNSLSSDNSDGINVYTPLERPMLHYEAPKRDNARDIPEMEADATSSSKRMPPALLRSDSESDEESCSKRYKMSSPVPRKYNNIWNKDPDGDLTDFLNQVGMDEPPSPENCRNVENYPLPFPRNKKESKSWNFRQKKRKIANKKKIISEVVHMKKTIRILDALEVNETNTIEEVAEDIIRKLQESNQELILKIVIVLGKLQAIQLYERTRVIEKLGGMLIANCSRKRTSGGVFIFLVRNDKDLPEDKIRAIFENDYLEQKKVRNAVNKIRKKRKKKNLRRDKSKNNSSELSNPPPSPDLPDLPPKKDVLTELAKGQQGLSNIQIDVDEDGGDDDLKPYEDMDLPEIV